MLLLFSAVAVVITVVVVIFLFALAVVIIVVVVVVVVGVVAAAAAAAVVVVVVAVAAVVVILVVVVVVVVVVVCDVATTLCSWQFSSFLVFAVILFIIMMFVGSLCQVCRIDPRSDTSWQNLKKRVEVLSMDACYSTESFLFRLVEEARPVSCLSFIFPASRLPNSVFTSHALCSRFYFCVQIYYHARN